MSKKAGANAPTLPKGKTVPRGLSAMTADVYHAGMAATRRSVSTDRMGLLAQGASETRARAVSTGSERDRRAEMRAVGSAQRTFSSSDSGGFEPHSVRDNPAFAEGEGRGVESLRAGLHASGQAYEAEGAMARHGPNLTDLDKAVSVSHSEAAGVEDRSKSAKRRGQRNQMVRQSAAIQQEVAQGLADAEEEVRRVLQSAEPSIARRLILRVESEGGYYDQVRMECRDRYQVRMMMGSQIGTGWSLLSESKGLQGVDVDEAQDWIEIARSHLNSGGHFSVLNCEVWWDQMQNRTKRDNVARRVLEEKKGELIAAGNAKVSEVRAMWELSQVQLVGAGAGGAGEPVALRLPTDRILADWSL
jgi:hypothetical protein